MTMIKIRWHGFYASLTLALSLTLVVCCTWSVSKQQTPVANLLTSADRWTRQPFLSPPPSRLLTSPSRCPRQNDSLLVLWISIDRYCVALPSTPCSPTIPLCPFQNKTVYRTIDTTSGKMGDEWKNAKSVYEFNVKDINGEDVSMEKYKYGRVACAVLYLPSPLHPNPVNDIVTAHLCSVFCLDTPQR